MNKQITVALKNNEGILMSRKKYILGMMIVVFGINHAHGAPTQVETVMVYCVKEVIDGSTFIFREDVVNGVTKKIWTIDGKEVNQDDYTDEIVAAEMSVRRQERERAEQLRLQEQEEKMAWRKKAYIKMILAHKEQIAELLSKCEDAHIKPYISDQDLLLKADRLMHASYQELDWYQLQDMYNALDALPHQLQELLQMATNKAIQQCDDTKVLKELLGVS